MEEHSIALVAFGGLQVDVATVGQLAGVTVADGRPLVLARRRVEVRLELQPDQRRLQSAEPERLSHIYCNSITRVNDRGYCLIMAQQGIIDSCVCNICTMRSIWNGLNRDLINP